MSAHPALVVGLGRAGCSILSAVKRFVSDHDVDDRFQFLAIDSSSRDLHTIAPDAATTYELTIKREAYQRDRDAFRYLQSEAEFVPDAGTSRRRPLGRYLVDSAADSATLYQCLSDHLTALSDTPSDSTTRHVWVINSLGGGTGSGAFPLVTLLLQQCSQETEATVELFGLGSLPRLDRVQNQIDVPEGEPVHYANAYTALAELRGLMNLDGETEYPIDIDINSSPASVRTPSLSIDENPFAGYWLLGLNETDQFDAEYVSRMNRVVAQLIFYLASTDAPGWFRQGHLYSVDGVSITAPLDKLERYQSLDDELVQLDTELGALRDKRNALNEALKCIDSLLHSGKQGSLRSEGAEDSTSDATESFPFGEGLLDDCAALVTTMSNPLVLDESPAQKFDDRVLDIAETHQDTIPDHIPAEPAVTLLCAISLRPEIQQAIATHPLPDYLTKLQNKWPTQDADEYSRTDNSSTENAQHDSFEAWRDTLFEELHDRIGDLQQRVDDSLMPKFASAAGQELTALEDGLERAEQLSTEYDDLRALEAHLGAETERARQQLKEQRSHLEQRAEKAREEWETTQQRRGRLTQQRSRLAAEIEEPVHQDGRLQVSLQPDKASADNSPQKPTFSALLSSGLLTKDALRHSLNEAITLLNEPVEDLAESRFGKTTGQLGLIVPGGDVTLFTEILTGETDNSDSLHRDLSYYFEDEPQVVPGAQVRSLKLLGFYAPVSLQETSEFGVVHDYYTDSNADVASLLGSISDADIRERVAYPELLQ